MTEQANYFKLGAFVLGSFALGVLALVGLGAGAVFERRLMMETFIDESVQGLEIGSPVKYRGVQVGNVAAIELALQRYTGLSVTRRRFVRVVISLYPKAFSSMSERTPDLIQQVVEREALQGLRVRLTSQGLTGAAYLELDYLSPAPPRVVRIEEQLDDTVLLLDYRDAMTNVMQTVKLTPEHIYCPSAPSTLTQIGTAIGDAMKAVKDLEIPKIVDKLTTVLTTVNKAVKDLQVAKLSEDMQKLLTTVEGAVSDSDVGRISSEVVTTLRELRASNARLRALLEDPSLDAVPADVSASVKSVKKVLASSQDSIGELVSDARDVVKSLKRATDEDLARVSKQLPETADGLNKAVRRINLLLATQTRTIESLLRNLEVVSNNLRDVTGNARRYPSQVLFGAPPPRKR